MWSVKKSFHLYVSVCVHGMEIDRDARAKITFSRSKDRRKGNRKKEEETFFRTFFFRGNFLPAASFSSNLLLIVY